MDLRVFLKLDGAGFQQGLNKAESSVNSFAAKTHNTLVKQFGGAFSVGALSALHRETLKMASELTRLGHVTDLSTEKLYELGFAAEQSDVSLQTIATAYGRLVKSIMEARNGGDSAISAFKTLGVNVANIATLNADAAFKQIADGMKNIGDETEHTAALIRVFGRGATELKPILRELDEGMAKFRNQPIKPSAAEFSTLDAAGDEYNRMWHTTKSLGVKIAAGVERAHYGLANAWDQLASIVGVGIGGIFRKDKHWPELYEEFRAEFTGRNARLNDMKGRSRFVIREGDLPGAEKREVVEYRNERAVDITSDQKRAQEMLADIEERRWRRSLDALSYEKQRASILEKIAKLRKEAESEMWQGNDINHAKKMADIDELEALAGKIEPKERHRIWFSQFATSDALAGVGNFLGAGRGNVDSVARETNRILKEHTVLLREIAYKPVRLDIGVP